MTHVETNTNRHLRKKYFVDADAILTWKKSAETPEPEHDCRVIDSRQVHMSKVVRKVGTHAEGGKSGRMNVQVIKDGDRVEQVLIACPCGRHAELDCRYEPAAIVRPFPERARVPERGVA